MIKKETTQRFILLPANKVAASGNANPHIEHFLTGLSKHNSVQNNKVTLSVRNAPDAKAAAIHLKVVDSIREDGAKLVEIGRDEMADFRFSYPGLRIIPEQFYHKPPMPFPEILIRTKKSNQTVTSVFTIADKMGNPVPDAYVVAFTHFASRQGAGGTSNKAGKLQLNIIGEKIERLYVYPAHTYWGYYKTNVAVQSAINIPLSAINTEYKDSLRFFYKTTELPEITHPVKVAVIDTGVGPHGDLQVAGGANTIEGEDEKDFSDNGDGHGTHVAGIIAANGKIKGVAAGVQLYSYRVFPKSGNASSFYIMKAIKKAVDDGCDLINMSLGSPVMDEGLISYVKEAYNNGVLCFSATGNDDRKPVSYPAAYSLCIAVAAMGRKGTFPASTIQQSTVKAPFGTDARNFVADFSNVGPETDLVAPGVGIISTYPHNRYAVMDGTSMACPAAVGMAARLLAGRPDILQMPRNQQRTDEMLKFLSVHIKSLGFNATFEGKGMLFQNQ